MWITEKTIQKAVFPFPNTCKHPKHQESVCVVIITQVLTIVWCLCLRTYHSQHRKEDDHGQAGVSSVSTCIDVWVSLLIQFQHTQPSNHVHEGRICEEIEKNLSSFKQLNGKKPSLQMVSINYICDLLLITSSNLRRDSITFTNMSYFISIFYNNIINLISSRMFCI